MSCDEKVTNLMVLRQMPYIPQCIFDALHWILRLEFSGENRIFTATVITAYDNNEGK